MNGAHLDLIQSGAQEMFVDLNKNQSKSLPADLPGMFEVQMNLLITGVGKTPEDKTMSGTGRAETLFSNSVS